MSDAEEAGIVVGWLAASGLPGEEDWRCDRCRGPCFLSRRECGLLRAGVRQGAVCVNCFVRDWRGEPLKVTPEALAEVRAFWARN